MLKPLLLTILDIGVSCFIITPLVVTFWATVWDFAFRYPDWFPLWWTLGVSWALQITVTLLRDSLYEVHVKIRGWSFKIMSRLYIYLYCLVGVMGWRAVWFLMEKYFDLRHTSFALAVCLVPFVVISGSVNNLLALPYSIGVDHDRTSLYKYNTVFNVESTQNLGWYLLDCVFSVCVVGTLVVSVWRGHWSLLEIYLYPGEPAKSAIASLAIGYALVIVTFLLQPVMKYLARTLKGIFRLLAVDIYLLISFSGTINVWRGIWNCLNNFFLPNLPLLSFFITHSLCFLLLVLINSSNSILVRGVYIDCQEDGEQCVDFPCYYIRLFFQERRKKKLLRASQQRRQSRRLSENETLMAVKRAPEIVSNHSSSSPTANSV